MYVPKIHNNLFSQKVLDMRNYIFKYLEKITPVANLKSFYEQTQQLWGDISEHGKEIMKAKNFLEIELREDALEKLNCIYNKFNVIFSQKGRIVLEHQKTQLKSKNQAPPDDFAQVLSKEFMIQATSLYFVTSRRAPFHLDIHDIFNLI